jgi:hypothetical protein
MNGSHESSYLPFRYTITPPIPRAIITAKNVMVLTSMISPYDLVGLLSHHHADSLWSNQFVPSQLLVQNIRLRFSELGSAGIHNEIMPRADGPLIERILRPPL